MISPAYSYNFVSGYDSDECAFSSTSESHAQDVNLANLNSRCWNARAQNFLDCSAGHPGFLFAQPATIAEEGL